MRQKFTMTISNVCELFRQYLRGEITLDEFRKAKIISETKVIYKDFDDNEQCNSYLQTTLASPPYQQPSLRFQRVSVEL